MSELLSSSIIPFMNTRNLEASSRAITIHTAIIIITPNAPSAFDDGLLSTALLRRRLYDDSVVLSTESKLVMFDIHSGSVDLLTGVPDISQSHVYTVIYEFP